ncbi:MAG: hypothetical protein ABJK37_17425 [Paraglaciecola sp.]|uniref:hypothetical protein n=1 Tax=Paraglaciecola sp. TaxID=1920173 RepID=UPI0032991A77
MKIYELPKSISSLINELQVVQIDWQNIPIQIPKFAVYAILENPLFDQFMFRNGKRIGLLQLGQYTVPVIEPFRADTEFHANFAVIISHNRGNHFGLYGFPADNLEADLRLSRSDGAANTIVSEYL